MVDLEASSCNASLLIASSGFVHRMAVRLIRKGSFTSASSRLQSLHASLSAQQALKSGLKDNSRTLIKISFQIAEDVPLILSLPQNLEIQFYLQAAEPQIARCLHLTQVGTCWRLVSRVWDSMALFMGLECVGKVFMGLLYTRRQST